MLFKQSSKKSIGSAQKLKPKTCGKKAVSNEKIKKPSKHKAKKSEVAIKVPRTCLDSPRSSASKKLKRTSSCDNRKVINEAKVVKPIQKKSLKDKNRVLCNKNNLKAYAIDKMIISPIKKINLDFFNHEDLSIMKVLEIL